MFDAVDFASEDPFASAEAKNDAHPDHSDRRAHREGQEQAGERGFQYAQKEPQLPSFAFARRRDTRIGGHRVAAARTAHQPVPATLERCIKK